MAIPRTQFGAVTGSKRPRNQRAELNARQSQLPTIIANQQKAEGIARQEEQFSRQHKLATDRFAFEQSSTKQARAQADRASQVGMGLAAGKLGVNIGLSHGDKTVGGLIQSGKNMWNGTPNTVDTASTGTTGMLKGLSLGSAVGGGLAGYGVSQLLGKKSSKITKGLAGAGVGGLLGLLGGGAGGGISGTFGGALGSLFG